MEKSKRLEKLLKSFSKIKILVIGDIMLDRSSLKRAGDILFDRLKCEFLVITRGEEGMTILKSNREPFDVSTIAKDVYDVTGAGDTVIGTMALAWGAGATIREAAELANYAAGIVVGKMGTATVSQEELMNVIKEKPRTK